MRSYSLIFILACMSLNFGCSDKKNKKTTNIEVEDVSSSEKETIVAILSTEEYKQVVTQEGTQLVDVRTPGEYANGTLPGAENIDFFDTANFETSFDKYDRSKPLYIFCQSGNRSGQSLSILQEMGFEEVYDLDGGYLQWMRDQE